MRPGLMSVRVRLTAWYAVSLAVVILLFSVGIYIFVRSSLLRQLDRHLEGDIAGVEITLRKELDEAQEKVEEEIKDEMEDIGVVALFQVTCGDRIVYRTAGWDRARLSDAAGSMRSDHPWLWTSPDSRVYRLKASGVQGSGRTFDIMVALDMAPISNALHILAVTLIVSLPCALAVAVIGGYFLAGRVLSPIGAIAGKARQITAERLSERLPVENPDDEFGRLAIVFNDTLSRLEESFERLRRFTADASHELRTPLTALRSVGEVGLRDKGDVASCRNVIGSMLEEVDSLAILVDNLLMLTRTDSGQTSLKREVVDIALLVNEAVECLYVLTEEKGQTLSVEIEQSISIEADRTTLRQALINLLDNAIKYTPEKGCIRVVARQTGNGNAVVEIADTGPGIGQEHQSRVFERFYRVDKDRSSERGGAGLGLAIARRAVELNGGCIELKSEQGAGSTFRIILPARKGGDAI